MTKETHEIEIKNKGLLLFGIILLLIGLVASFYRETYYIYGAAFHTYPYMGIGIILVLGGIALTILGFFYSTQKS